MVQVAITKAAGELLGVAVVESGWGSILPTVVVANLLHGGAAERSGELSIGDRIMSVNGTSMVGLPITTCQNIIRVRREETAQTYHYNVKSSINNYNNSCGGLSSCWNCSVASDTLPQVFIYIYLLM